MPEDRKIVLVTEDEPPMLRILTDKLHESNLEVLQAKNGEEGLTIALQQHPDLILLDILLPKLDGMTMLRKLREDNWGKSVPIIILTNVSPDSNEILQEIVNTQPAYYFVKSNTKLEDIIEKTKEILFPDMQQQVGSSQPV